MTTAAMLPSSAPGETARGAGADFPTWLPPMLVKELRQGLRARSFVSGMVTVHTGMALLLGWVLLHSGRELAGAAEAVRSALWFIAAAVLLLLTPRRAEGLGAEMKERTLDPLLLTQLDGTRIVVGKWISLLAQAALVVVALLPYGLLQYYFGDMDVLRDAAALAGLLLASAALTAGALLFSTLARWQTTVVGAGGLALLVLGPVFVFFFKLASAPPTGVLLLPSTGTLIALAVYDAALAAALSLVLAAWRLDRRNRSKLAWRAVLLSLPAAGVAALHSGWFALAQGCVCLALALTTLVASPRRRKKLREPAAPPVSAAPEPAALVSPPAAATRAHPAATPPPSAVRADFPTRLPPMLVKELRQGLRSRSFVAVFILAQLALTGAFLHSALGTDNVRAVVSVADGFFWTLMGGLLIFLAPLRARGALGAELLARNTDLLLLTRLTGWRIVTGKWVSLMAQSLLLAVSLLPFGLVRYYLGGAELYADFWRLAGFLFAGGVLTAMQILASVTRLRQRVLVIVCGLFSLIPLGIGSAALHRDLVLLPEMMPMAAIFLLVCDAALLGAQCLVSAGAIVDPQRDTRKETHRIAWRAAVAGVLAAVVAPGLLLIQLGVVVMLMVLAGIMAPDRVSPSPWLAEEANKPAPPDLPGSNPPPPAAA